jgi:YrbI family 3-deoxy-D-manno-octulosonate 8-phosphate phosphatase
MSDVSEELRLRCARVKLVVTDVDGVLTDDGMYYAESGEEIKRFNTRDGMGVARLREGGIETAIVTQETTEIVRRRAEKLGIAHLFQGERDKRARIEALAAELGLDLRDVAYIGDDVNDLEAIGVCGVSATVADGMPAVRAAVDYVCELPGGAGAFREFAELLLGARSMRQR